MTNSSISQKIISWYKKYARDLPWRNTRDPYKIWLSEVILQQTRVNQGLPYYTKFVDKFPKIEDLANASEQEVLRLWQGLGYYSRARNLHACAKVICSNYGGVFPKTYQEILKLPGIGNYTAAAISSFAFDLPQPAIDGNVFRVLARIFGIEEDILAAKNRKIFEAYAKELMPVNDPATYNQAMMEFGAKQCKPKGPLCESCPVSIECYARKNKAQDRLPVKLKKTKVRKRNFYYLVIEHEGRFMMKKRKSGDIWQGLYDYPMIEEDKLSENAIQEKLGELGISKAFNLVTESESYKHVLSHQVINAKFLHIKTDSENGLLASEPDNKLNFYDIDEVDDLPKPVLVSRYLNEADF